MIVSEFVARAMKEIGALSSGENPEAEELEDGIQTFNWMLKSMAAEGANLFRTVEGAAIFLADTATVELDPYCSDVLEARLVQSLTFQRPMLRWDLGQYMQLPNKHQPGYPTAYYLSRTIGTLSMSVWPVPNLDMTILYTYARIPEDVLTGAETVDLPQQWTEAAYYSLASRLANMFGATRTDPASVQRVDAMSQMLMTRQLDSDRPASVFMGSYWGPRSF